MNKVIRVTISVPLAILVTTLLSTFLWWGTESVRRGALVPWHVVAYSWLLLSLLITVLPALLAGALIPILNLRPLWAAATGAVAQMLLPIIFVLLMAGNFNRDPETGVGFVVAWAFLFGTCGAVAGFICGLLSPRSKTVGEKYP